MSRKPRTRRPEITYHIVSRCIEKKPLMKPGYIKDLMLTVLNQALEKYTFELSGYTIMDNHFHLFIRTVVGGEDISRIMQFIKSQFARKYNRIMNRTGPFWNERFSDKIIEESDNPREAYKNVHLYMGYNPVRSGYVRDPRDYKYSSFNCYIDENYVSPVKVTLHPYFLNLGSTFKECARVILDFEEEYRRQMFMMEKVV
jgi:putative transposase